VIYRFGVFEFDSVPGELRKSGRLVALEPQPSRALGVLLARADELVTREELKDAVWGKGTHVDFDRGLAYLISQIRTALGDAGDSPRFIQTIPRKGYRFIAPVHAPALTLHRPRVPQADRSGIAPLGRLGGFGWRASRFVLAASVVCAAVIGGVMLQQSRQTPGRVVVAVSVFDNETGIADYDRLVSGLSDLVVTRLADLAPDRLAVVGNAAVLRQPRNLRNLKAVAAGVRADYVLLGQLQQADAGFRFITHFIRLSDETHLKANRLSFPDRDLSSLEQQVVGEFERNVRLNVLSAN
jgi:DNA-binding winged helix-turn-helix (wHTH) protein/TolB-like protein